MYENLINSAFEVLGNSYAPYSGFHVAAAVITDSGNIYTGVNVENASYPAGICAECNAVGKAASCGERKIRTIAIVGRDANGNSSECDEERSKRHGYSYSNSSPHLLAYIHDDKCKHEQIK